MCRTKFFGIKPTKSQFSYIANLLRVCAARGQRQYLELDSFNKHTSRIVLNNFFLVRRNGVLVWEGYKIILLGNGERIMDKEFVVSKVGGERVLVRPESFDIAA